MSRNKSLSPRSAELAEDSVEVASPAAREQWVSLAIAAATASLRVSVAKADHVAEPLDRSSWNFDTV